MGDVKEVHVDVILNPDGVELPDVSNRPEGYNLPFKLESDDLEVGSDNLLSFENKDHPGFEVHFHLRDPHKTGYLFPEDEREAMWVKKASPDGNIPCPTEKSYWGQFKAKEVKPGKKILVVRNFNEKGHQSKFGYTLRVTLNPNVEPITFAHLDPPGDNLNGHGLFDVKTAIATTLTVCGAVATAVYLGMESADLIGNNAGARLLVSSTVGFGIAALLFRLLSRR